MRDGDAKADLGGGAGARPEQQNGSGIGPGHEDGALRAESGHLYREGSGWLHTRALHRDCPSGDVKALTLEATG